MQDKGFTEFISYEYSSNKNIVLRAKRRAKTDGPTGEVENLDPSSMSKFGDRAKRTKAPKIQGNREERKRISVKRGNVLSADVNSHKYLYQPKSQQTSVVFENLLSFVLKYLGDVDSETIHAVVDEVLRELKDETTTDKEKFRSVRSLLDGIEEGEFSSLVRIGKQITDYYTDSGEDGMDLDEDGADVGMSLVFEERKDVAFTDVVEDNDEDEDTGEEAAQDDILEFKKEENELDVRSITGNFVSELLSKYGISEEVKETEETILSVLSDEENSEADCENELSQLLNFNMELLEILLSGRWKIVFCVRLARNPGERKAIMEELEMNENLRGLLVELEGEEYARKKEEIRQLDLEGMQFEQGSHLMTNSTCELPPDLKRSKYPSYEEIFIPAPQLAEVGPKELVAIESLPAWAQKAFPAKTYRNLNRIQSRVYKRTLYDGGNMLVCAPTGAGKTNIAVLCILREIGKFGRIDEESGEFLGLKNRNFKVVYIAPMKALVQEVVGKLRGRLTESYGINVGELTGDSTMTSSQIERTQVIVATPEKWDIVTRKREDRTFADNVKLVIIDEIHLLHDERGPVLEAIIARSLRYQERSQLECRLLGISATLPNYKDVALLLRVPKENLFHFDGSFRPVPLEQFYIGVSERKALKRRKVMNEVCYQKVVERAKKDQQIIIFVHSRKETGKTAAFIRDLGIEKGTISTLLDGRTASKHILSEVAESDVQNRELKQLLPYGLAIHHAGMLRDDRNFVEDLFADKHVRVLVSTATLAWGVNLPAHTVIIKGTQVYNPEKGMWTELSFLDVMQMMGRAGRPDFDKEGEGILITSDRELLYYLSLLNQQLPVESQFVKKMCDNLNAEIVQGSVESLDEGVDYLAYTYLYIRMMRNPGLYQIDQESKKNDPKLKLHRMNLVHSCALHLHQNGLIAYDKRTGAFVPTALGRIASHYYLPFSSMKTYSDYLKPHLTEIGLFRVFALSQEFKFMVCRQEEKMELQTLYSSVPLPIKEGVDEPTSKVNLLLQAYISKRPLRCFSLVSDLTYVIQSASRILRALFEIAHQKRWAQLAVRLLTLAKMVERRMWSSQCPLRQFKKMSPRLIQQLEKKDITWDQLYDLSVAELGELIRFPKKGRDLYKRIHQFPRLDLTAQVQPLTSDLLKFEIVIQADFQYSPELHGPAQLFHIFVEDTTQETILHSEIFLLRASLAQDEHFVSFNIPTSRDKMEPLFFIRVVSDRWIGSQTVLPVFLKDLILPKKENSFTVIGENVSELPVSKVFGNEKFRTMLSNPTFSRLQSHVVTTLCETEGNLYVGVPVGSGEDELVKFAVLKEFNAKPQAISVVLSSTNSQKLYEKWVHPFKNVLGVECCQLSGQLSRDLRSLSSSNVIFSDVAVFDQICRKWNSHKAFFEKVDLVVVRNLHLIGGTKGHSMEVVITRLLIMKKLLQSKMKIVCFGIPVECPKDISLWLGAGKNFINCHPNMVKLKSLDVYGFTNPSYKSRLLSMTRKCYLLVKKEVLKKQIIVFCSSVRASESVCLDLMNYVRSEIIERKLLFSDEVSEVIERIENESLKRLASFGVPFLHSSMSGNDKDIVMQLYKSKAVHFVAVDKDFIWDLELDCNVGVIMGTEYYNGAEHRYSPYSIVEMNRMISRCVFNSGEVFVYCKKSLEKYYETFLVKRPLPIESHLDHTLADHLNSEISNGLVESHQNAIDFLTNSFLFRRIRRNPNYYNLHGLSNQHLQEFLSQLTENTLNDLVQANCIEVDENEGTFKTLNLGKIASELYINFASVDLFNSSVTAETKMRGLLEILSASSEFDNIPFREGEGSKLEEMAKYAPLKVSNMKFSDSQTKVNLLLQAHFSRIELGHHLSKDLRQIVEVSHNLLKGMINVISTNGWLKPVVAAIELQQMIVQAVWDSSSYLKQLPGFSDELVKKFESEGCETVFDLIEMDDEKRTLLLTGFPFMNKLAKVLNGYPNIDLEFEVLDKDEIAPESLVTVNVALETEEEEEIDTDVLSDFYPQKKSIEWWLLIGDNKANELCRIKKMEVLSSQNTSLKFYAPPEKGTYSYSLFFMCDSYTGCDQEYDFQITVK